MGFGDLPYAQQLRDVIAELIGKELTNLRPLPKLATVVTIDDLNNSCTVLFPGDTTPVPIKMFTLRPLIPGGPGVGSVVRVAGVAPTRYVADVVNGGSFMKLGGITVTALQSAGASANMVVDSVTGVVSRVTSSLRYKKNVKSVTISDEIFSKLRAIQYQPKDSTNTSTYLGLIAEELAELNDPVINLLVARDEAGEPDAVNYDRVALILLPVIQRLVERVEVLESGLPSA